MLKIQLNRSALAAGKKAERACADDPERRRFRNGVGREEIQRVSPTTPGR